MSRKIKWRNKRGTLTSTKPRKQETAILTGAMLAMGLAGPIQADGHKPAVSAPNAKIDLSAASIDGDGAGFLSGSGTVPLGHSYGFQLDAIVGDLDSHNADGFAGHLFYRDPDKYMFGVTAQSLNYRSRDVNRVGIEAEKYYPGYTLGLKLGNQSGDLGTDAYYNLNYTYYYDDDMSMKAEFRGYGDNPRITLGTEWQTRSGWSLFADASAGDGDEYILAGVRLYLGKNKSLKLRHREDDPDQDIVKTAHEIKQDADKNEYVAPSGDGGDGGCDGDCVD